MPVWSSQLFTKEAKLVRTSSTVFHPDGTVTNDFSIEVGEYPRTVGVPVRLRSSQGTVTTQAVSLSGWPKLLPEASPLKIQFSATTFGAARRDSYFNLPAVEGEQSSGTVHTAVDHQAGRWLKLTLPGRTRVVIRGPEVRLPKEAGGKKVPFIAELLLVPQHAGQEVELMVDYR
jgi:hypothetical protein